MDIKRLDESYKVLPLNYIIHGSTKGTGSTTNKYARISSTLTSNGSNSYTLSVRVYPSSSAVYNGYGQKVYAVIGGTPHHLGTFNMTNGAEYTGSKTFTVSSDTIVYGSTRCAACESGAHADDGYFTNQTTTDKATYTPLVTVPSAPGGLSQSGKYYMGEKTSLSWNSVSNATSYNLYYNVHRVDGTNDGWKKYGSVTGTSGSITWGGMSGEYVQLAVTAVNSAGESGKAYSPSYTYRSYNKVWNGSSWVVANPIKVWNGSSWVYGVVKVWNGSSWVHAT